MKSVIVVWCSALCFIAVVFAHSNNTHGNNPWVQAVVDFGVDPAFAMLASGSGSADTASALICGSNAWNDCVNDIYGPFQSEMSECIELYLCAYWACSECDGIAYSVCMAGVQYDLYNCSGIDLMSLMERWGTDHDTTVELLR